MQTEHPAATVLRRVQEELRRRLPAPYRQSNIYIGKFSDALPPGISCPAIGIRRRASKREQYSCSKDQWTVEVAFQCWEEDGGTPDAAVLGSSSQRGILGIEWDINNILWGNRLGFLEGGIPVSDADVASDGGTAKARESDSGKVVQFSTVVWSWIVQVNNEESR